MPLINSCVECHIEYVTKCGTAFRPLSQTSSNGLVDIELNRWKKGQLKAKKGRINQKKSGDIGPYNIHAKL